MVDLEITTHVRCAENAVALEAVLHRYLTVLQSIGFVDPDLEEQLSSVMWEPDGSGFGYLGKPLVYDTSTVNGQLFMARPYVLGYTDAAIKGLKIPWVQLSLVFEDRMAELLIDRLSGRMREGAGSVIWRIAQGFSAEFHDSGVFFNDSVSVNEAWNSLTGRGGNLWAFDLALIPTQLASHFWPIPEGYTHISLSEALGLARLVSWDVLPWADRHDETR